MIFLEVLTSKEPPKLGLKHFQDLKTTGAPTSSGGNANVLMMENMEASEVACIDYRNAQYIANTSARKLPLTNLFRSRCSSSSKA